MTRVKRVIVSLILSTLYRPFLLRAQDGGMNIDNLEVADSLYMEQPFMADAVMKNSGSGNTVIIIVVVLAVVAAAALFIWMKRKK